jgi:hypothetical protein
VNRLARMLPVPPLAKLRLPDAADAFQGQVDQSEAVLRKKPILLTPVGQRIGTVSGSLSRKSL